ncbi:MAG: hypothetical protein IKU80_01915 [Firmicutes bacterium]|nr:hypothetical protein [Bacillota bacterium]
MSDFQEKDLYDPVCRMLEEAGYEVKAEVKNCDIAAVMDGEITVVELKKAFNIKLVYQLLERQSFSKYVYAAIPRPKDGNNTSSFKSMIKLLKKIDCGLITVAMDSPVKTVDVILDPSGEKKITSHRKKKQVGNEFSARSGNLNVGGVNKTEIITAYRERSIEMLCLAEKHERISGAFLKELGYGQKEYSIFYKNYYGWFEKAEKGIYMLSEKGKEALEKEEYQNLIEYFRSDKRILKL